MAIGSGAIRGGRAFVELFADDSKLVQGLNAAKSRVSAFAATTAKIGLSMFAPFGASFAKMLKEGFDTNQLAGRFNTSAEAISTLRGAFAAAGVSGDEFAGTLDGLATKIAAAADSRDELIHGMTGLRGDMLLGKDINTQLDMIAEKFKTIVLAEDQIRVANELGLGGILKYLKRGKAGLDELRQTARDSGNVWSAQDAKDAAEIYEEVRKVLLSVGGAILDIGKALLPTGKSLKEFGADVRKVLADVRQWIKDHKSLVVITAGFAFVLLAVAAGAKAVAIAMGVVRTAILLVNAAQRIGIVLDILRWAAKNPITAAGGLLAIAGAWKLIKKVYSDEEEFAKEHDKNPGAAGGGAAGPGVLGQGGRLERQKPRVASPPMLYAHAHGTFGGPVAQQLGYSENVAQRQIALGESIDRHAEDIAAGIKNMDAKITGLVNAFQVR